MEDFKCRVELAGYDKCEVQCAMCAEADESPIEEIIKDCEDARKGIEPVCGNCDYFDSGNEHGDFCNNEDVRQMVGLNEFIGVDYDFGCNKFKAKE